MSSDAEVINEIFDSMTEDTTGSQSQEQEPHRFFKCSYCGKNGFEHLPELMMHSRKCKKENAIPGKGCAEGNSVCQYYCEFRKPYKGTNPEFYDRYVCTYSKVK